jgi:hypothetical protein
MPFDAELGEYFMRENYYNTVNLLRVYEFTVLDLLQVPKKLQGRFVTPLPPTAAGLHHWPEGLSRVRRRTRSLTRDKSQLSKLMLSQDFFTTGLGNVMENNTTAAILMLDRYYDSPDKTGAIDKVVQSPVDPLRLVSAVTAEQFFMVQSPRNLYGRSLTSLCSSSNSF